MKTGWIWAAVASAALAMAGCAHKPEVKEEVAQPPPVAPKVEAAPAPVPEAAAETTCSTDGDCPSKSLCIRNKCVPITADLAECSVQRVNFDFDAWTIHEGDRPQLERMARCLRADSAMHVTIEGNADERGTEEYNLQLGQKRATAVEKYLEALGVAGAQLKTISYGFERPVCSEHNEDCWAKNRRGEVKPVEAKTK